VSDAARELFLLVGADKDELLAGIFGRVAVLDRIKRSLSPDEKRVSETGRRLRDMISRDPVAPSGAVVGRLAELIEWPRERDLLFLADDLKEDRRCGITTT
jgi:hypothetical protein